MPGRTPFQPYDKKTFGDVRQGHYAKFEDDGTLVFYGNATYWNDLPPVRLTAQKLAGAGADPVLATFLGNTKQYTFSVNDLVPGLESEILHGYKEGTDITIHVHWVTNGSDGTARGVKWQVEYTVANGSSTGGYVFPATTTVSSEITIPANTTDRTHFISNIGTISGTGLKIGAYIIAAISRIAAAGTAPTSDPFCLALGYHAENDTLGSRLIFTK